MLSFMSSSGLLYMVLLNHIWKVARRKEHFVSSRILVGNYPSFM
jgi:hypothetical protein